jgi:hypothetical protein
LRASASSTQSNALCFGLLESHAPPHMSPRVLDACLDVLVPDWLTHCRCGSNHDQFSTAAAAATLS